MYRERIAPWKKDATVCAEIKQSTFVHRSNGKQSTADYQKSRRLLIEEDVLAWRCEVLQRARSAQTPNGIRKDDQIARCYQWFVQEGQAFG